MSKSQPTLKQIAVLDYVAAMQRQCRAMLEDAGLTDAASRVAQFDDPVTYSDDDEV